MEQLNIKYRSRQGSTNVLSFPFESLPGLPELTPPELGDIVVCVPQVYREAHDQTKTVQNHLAHLVIHGVLHLNGFTHDEYNEEQKMQARRGGGGGEGRGARAVCSGGRTRRRKSKNNNEHHTNLCD